MIHDIVIPLTAIRTKTTEEVLVSKHIAFII